MTAETDFRAVVYDRVWDRLGMETSIELTGADARLKRNFDAELDALLNSYRWGFAEKEAVLTQDPAESSFFYSKIFSLPKDFNGLVFANSDKSVNVQDVPYTIRGGHYLCFTEHVYMVYTQTFSDEIFRRIPAPFRLALEIMVSKALSPFYRQSEGFTQSLAAEFKMLKLEAVETERRNTSSMEKMVVDSLLNARQSGSFGDSGILQDGRITLELETTPLEGVPNAPNNQ